MPSPLPIIDCVDELIEEYAPRVLDMLARPHDETLYGPLRQELRDNFVANGLPFECGDLALDMMRELLPDATRAREAEATLRRAEAAWRDEVERERRSGSVEAARVAERHDRELIAVRGAALREGKRVALREAE